MAIYNDPRDLYKLEPTWGGYAVTAPDGRVYMYESFNAAKKAMDSKMRIDKRTVEDTYPDNNDSYPDYPPPKEAAASYDKVPKETIDYMQNQLSKQEATIKELVERNNIENTPNQFAKALVKSQTQKIQNEIDRIEAQLAKSTDPEKKEKMNTYVAGLHKALKLIAE